MRSFLPSLGFAGAMAACLVSGSAFAYATGQTGYSGKDSSLTCANSMCHSPGSAVPTVTLEGPSTLAPGQTGSYSLIIRGGPAVRAGFNVAIDGNGGSLTPDGADSRKASGELTHSQPKLFSNGQARFDFSLVAPASGATITLFGAGNSVNGSTDEMGDASATTQLKIKVGDGGGTGGGEEDDGGGCAAAGGAPLLGAALMLLGARLRRRNA